MTAAGYSNFATCGLILIVVIHQRRPEVNFTPDYIKRVVPAHDEQVVHHIRYPNSRSLYRRMGLCYMGVAGWWDRDFWFSKILIGIVLPEHL
ncbi:hypothetical protein M426DRAFT_84928 [Hypoxylon sp. CI-4A]|nr:hypothetical protein M426DRAFT_84928 [Hypoxylon sp. CI-4A]